MQIMIELPDKVLARIRSRHGHCENVKYGNGIWTDDLLTVSTAIYFGTILSKGHGALKDADKLAVAIAMIRDKHNYYGDECERALFEAYDNCVDEITDAPTIIEADEEVEEYE